jgi:Skp family chaperone for outer membrane proteins
MKTSKTFLAAVSIALLLPAFYLFAAGQSAAPRAPVTIGYVSATRILTESVDAKAEVARLQGIQQQKANDLRGKQLALETTRQQLAQGGDAASRTQLLQQEQTQRLEFERANQQVQADLQTEQRQFNTNLQNKVKAAVADVVKTQSNIQLVLNGDNSVVWAAPGMDLTTAVVERMNAAKN